MSLGGGGAGKEAERARQEEEARQQRVRQGTADINRIFDGGVFGTGAATTFDPNATYYRADGSVWAPTPVPAPTPAAAPTGFVPEGRGGQRIGTVYSSSMNGGRNFAAPNAAPARTGPDGAAPATATPSLAQQFADAQANGGLFTGTARRGGFNDDFYKGIRDGFTNYAMPQLQDQRDKAAKELAFSLDRSGQLAGSVRGQKAGELQKLFDINEQQVRDQALAYENQARTSVENARSDLIGMLNATGDNQGAVNSALSRATILTQPQAYSPLGQLFTSFTDALGSQAAQERAAAASGGTYKPRYNTGLFGGPGQVTVRQ